MTAEPGGRSGPGPLIRALGRAVNSAVARFPWSWRLFRRPVRRFFDSVAAGWDERVRSDSPEYLMPLQAALDRLQARPARILDIGTGTGAAALELADRYPDAEVVGIGVSENSEVGKRSAIRADEGVPIAIGEDADIGERVTFHALKGTELKVGGRLIAGDGVVLHGPLEVGDNLRVGDQGVIFRCKVGNDVTMGEGAIIAGLVDEDGVPQLEIPDGTIIPEGAVITNQEELDGVLAWQEQRQ